MDMGWREDGLSNRSVIPARLDEQTQEEAPKWSNGCQQGVEHAQQRFGQAAPDERG